MRLIVPSDPSKLGRLRAIVSMAWAGDRPRLRIQNAVAVDFTADELRKIRIESESKASTPTRGNMSAGQPREFLLSPWSEGLACDDDPDGWDQPSRIHRILDHRLLEMRDNAPALGLEAFFKDFPEGIDVFGSGPGHVTRVLQLAAQHPWALDLLRSNPALLWLVVAYRVLNRITRDQALALLGKRQPDILAGLRLPASAENVRLLTRMRGPTILDNKAFGRTIVTLLAKPALVARLRHAPVLYPDALAVLCEAPDLSDNLILETLRRGPLRCKTLLYAHRDGSVQRLHERGLQAAREIGIKSPQRMLEARNTLEGLSGLLESWCEQAEQRRRQIQQRFPMPPLLGSDTIVPIRNVYELEQESREMRHCVRTYAARVNSGRSFIYKVLAPERATLELTCYTYRNQILWRVNALKLAHNREPDRRTWKAVGEWMYMCRVRDERWPQQSLALTLGYPLLNPRQRKQAKRARQLEPLTLYSRPSSRQQCAAGPRP